MLNAWSILARRKIIATGPQAMIMDASVDNTLAEVAWRLRTDGWVQYDDLGLNTDYVYSLTPTLFEVRATKISGQLPLGSALGSWLSLGTTARFWYFPNSGVSKTCLLSIELRRASDFVVVSTATISLSYDNGA